MHDEAAPTYVDMLDNTAIGQRHIAENFGVAALPKITWRTYTFSPAMAPARPRMPNSRTPIARRD